MIKINWKVHSFLKHKPENLFQNRICGLYLKIDGIVHFKKKLITSTTRKKGNLSYF